MARDVIDVSVMFLLLKIDLMLLKSDSLQCCGWCRQTRASDRGEEARGVNERRLSGKSSSRGREKRGRGGGGSET